MYKQNFVTSALPYANGFLHLGHILEFIQTDIWVKFRNFNGKMCFYFSGIDAHGTPIMLKSLDKQINPENLISNFFLGYKTNLSFFNINCDNFYRTNSYENEMFSRKFFFKLYEKKLLFIKNISQFYDNHLKLFLPDRYIIGTCPACNAHNQYGDICDQCNFNYLATDLINPISKLSGKIPEEKISKHYFFKLKNFSKFLNQWCSVTLTQSQVLNKLKEWFSIGLNDWDVSRDMPYFGIKIPLEYEKFFYVWADAPLGYFASAQNYFKKFNINFIDIFFKKKNLDFYHFIGKDIIYFHSLFFPSMLVALNFKLPKDIFTHGFLTVNGLKMSKSSNTFILADDLSCKVRSDFLRFYLASKLHNGLSDIDFSFTELCSSVNSNLIGKFFNIISRVTKILNVYYDSFLSDKIDDVILFDEFLELKNVVFDSYNNRNYSKVINLILHYADKINIYLDKEKPWYLVKDKLTAVKGHNVCTAALNLFLILLHYLEPVIPETASRIKKCLNLDLNKFFIKKKPLLSIRFNKYECFIQKIKNE